MPESPDKPSTPALLPADPPPPYYRNFLREELAQRHSHAPQVLRLGAAAKALGIPVATLRDIRFHSLGRYAASGRVIDGNGFAPAFLTLGRAVYVDLMVFNQIWRTRAVSHSLSLGEQI